MKKIRILNTVFGTHGGWGVSVPIMEAGALFAEDDAAALRQLAQGNADLVDAQDQEAGGAQAEEVSSSTIAASSAPPAAPEPVESPKGRKAKG